MIEQPLRLLLVDDETSVREPLAKHLRIVHHYEVDMAADAQAALSQLVQARGDYDVALIDDLLVPAPGQEPEPLGVALTTEIKARYPKIEVILFTGWGMKSGLEALRAGAYRYLAKPLNLEELGMLIQTAAEHSRLKSAAREKQILEQLMKTSPALLSGQSLSEVLNTILRGVQAIGFDRVGLYLLSEDRQIMVGQAQVGMPAEFVGHTRPVSTDIYMQILMTDPRPQVFEREEGQPLPYERELGREGVNQWACVPLILQGEVIGKLSMDNKFSQQPIVESELGPVGLFAAQAATAIKNARLYEEVTLERDRSKSMARQLLALHKITQEMQSELDLSNLLNLISRLAAELLGADAGGILLLDESKQHLTFKGAYGLSQKAVEGTRDVVGGSIAGRVVKAGEPIIANDIPNDSRFDNPAADGEGWLAIMSTPLRVRGKIIGTLDVHNKSDRHAFDKDDLQILSLMANQAAIAIENVRLFQQTSHRALALETLHRTSLDITSRRPMPELVKSILDRAVELLQAEGGCLYQLDEAGKLIRVVAVSNRPDLKVGMTREVQNDVVGQVIKTRVGLSVPDYKNWPDRGHQNDPHSFSVVAGAPVAWQDKIWGAIAIHDEVEGRNFGQEELSLLSHLGNLAAVALENADLVTKDEDKLHRLEKLARANSEIMSNLATMSLDDRLNLIAQHATEILEAEACSILLVKHPEILSLEASYGYRSGAFEKHKEFAICSGPRTGLTGHIAYEGKLFNAYGNDLADHPAVRGGPAYAASGYCYSLLAIPLKNKSEKKEEVVGLLRVDNKQDRNGQIGPTIGFTQEDEWILRLFADAVIVAIEGTGLVAQLSEQKDHLVHLHEITDRHRQLLMALDEASRHIRAEKETSKLLQAIVRLAAELVGCNAGGLFINRSQLEELELSVTYELPTDLVGSRLSYAEGLVGQVARTGQAKIAHQDADWPDRQAILEPYHFKTIVGVPLKQAGEVEAVLLVANSTNVQQFSETDLEIVERFAATASLALQTSRLMSREQRVFAQLAGLHKISNYIQAARDLNKILHVVLTGVTAGYGLGFNRAALLLLDEKQESLIGRMGIGHLDLARAWEDWALHRRHGREDFNKYLELLEQDALPLTPIGERISRLRLPLAAADQDVFSRVMLERCYVLVTPDELDKLPDSFNKVFGPALPFVVVPLVARDQILGLLVADNKFTQSPITPEDIESLLTVANTAAVAIDNIQLFHETEVARERLRSFYEASNTLVSSRDPERVLQDTVERASAATGACGASMILIDQMGQSRYWITTGINKQFDILKMVRPNGLSVQIMLTGEPEVIEDTSKQRDRVNPSVFERGIGAALGLPVTLEGKRIGVMWIDHDEPHHFSKHEVDSMQLYVNQAAIAYDSARRIKELEYIRQAAEALAGAAGLPEVLEQIVCSAQEVLQADSAAILPYDDIQDRFILDRSVVANIPNEYWREFQKVGPRQGGTAYTVMERGWVGIMNVDDLERYGFLGEATRKLLGQIGTQSFQGIALTVGEEKLGVLYVNYNRPRIFSEEEREITRTFANHAALPLKKAKLLDQVSKARNTAKIVAEVTALENLDDTLRSVVEGTMEVVGCDAVTVYVYDQDKDQLGHPPTLIGVRYPERARRLSEVERDSIVFEILKRDQIYIVDDLSTDPLFQNRRFARDEQIVACVALPLKVGIEKVGVMFVNYRRPHRFTDDKLTNIGLFAHQAAVAIRNAQLYEEAQKRATALQALYQASLNLTAELSVEAVLEEVVHHARQLTEAQYGALGVLDAEDKINPFITSGLDATRKERIKFAPKGRGVLGLLLREPKPIRVRDIRQHPNFTGFPSHHPEMISFLGVPILSKGTFIGSLYMGNKLGAAEFSQEDQDVLGLLAAQTAIAIQNARLFEEAQRRARLLDAAAKVARDATATLEVNELLDVTARLISDFFGFYHVGVFLLDHTREYAVLRAASSEGGQRMLERSHKLKMGQEGIVGFVTKTGKPRLTSNVKKDRRHYPNPDLPNTLSEMAFPLIARGQVFGALDLQSTEIVNLREEDIITLQTMADQLANAIHNAQQYEELKRTKGLVGARTALAWMGMATSTWRHAIDKHALTIREQLQLLSRNLDQTDPSKHYSQLSERLSAIERLANKILEKPLTPPLTAEEGVESVTINDLIGERAKQLWQNEPYKTATLQIDLQLSGAATVKISREWLRRAFDILVDNAIDAVAGREVRAVVIGTRPANEGTEIFVSDTGPGLPQEIQEKIGLEVIEKPEDAKGLGMGLLMAQTIVQTYSGALRVDTTGPMGTIMVIWLPLENVGG